VRLGFGRRGAATWLAGWRRVALAAAQPQAVPMCRHLSPVGFRVPFRSLFSLLSSVFNSFLLQAGTAGRRLLGCNVSGAPHRDGRCCSKLGSPPT
jgi:hypothetical protein